MRRAASTEHDREPVGTCIRDGARFEPARSVDAELERKLKALAPSCAYKVISIAAALHVSERQLRRLVHASFGMSPNRWLRKQRMRAVLELLMDAESVKEAALSFGYVEVSQFSRDFKHQFGCTPSSVLGQHAKLHALAETL